MKKGFVCFVIFSLTGLICIVLARISHANTYTGVRSYLMPPNDTLPPTIEILDYRDGQQVRDDSIVLKAHVTDNFSKQENITIEGLGIKQLHTGFNSFVISARDEQMNVASTFIILEKID